MFALALAAMSTTLKAQSTNCANFPNHIATQVDWTPRCFTLNTLQGNGYGAVKYKDPISLTSHLWFQDCFYFGRPGPGEGGIMLGWGRDIDTTALGHAISQPTGKTFAIELSTAGPVDMLRVWTWDGATKTVLDSVPARASGLPLDDGYYHAVDVGWTPNDPGWSNPNDNRLRVKVDGILRMDLIYDITNLLFAGDTTATAWYTGEEFQPGCKLQSICLLSATCPTGLGPVVFCSTQAPAFDQPEGEDTLATAIATPTNLGLVLSPNPSTAGFLKVQIQENSTYRIMTATGSILKTGSLQIGTNTLTTQNLTPGTYCLFAISNTTQLVATRTFVITR